MSPAATPWASTSEGKERKASRPANPMHRRHAVRSARERAPLSDGTVIVICSDASKWRSPAHRAREEARPVAVSHGLANTVITRACPSRQSGSRTSHRRPPHGVTRIGVLVAARRDGRASSPRCVGKRSRPSGRSGPRGSTPRSPCVRNKSAQRQLVWADTTAPKHL